MIFLLALSFFHIGTFAVAAEDFNPLGRGVYLPQFDLLGNLRESGSQVLRSSAVPQCTITAKQDVSSRGFKFYKNTEEFYSSMTTSSGLESSLQTDFSLSQTLDQASENVGGSDRRVTGNSLYFVASYRQEILNKDCLNYGKDFDEKFLDSFQSLPVNIPQPWMDSDWKEYDIFLKKYGSHVFTSISVGSMINQMAFAETSDSYTERDFQVKSCMSLGISSAFGVSMCSDIDKSEASRVSKMNMRGELVIKGGTTETRNELIKNRTADLIEKFMNEANATNAAIQYTLSATWDILLSLYVGKDNDNFIKAVNLEFYYLGFLNYGCNYQTNGGQDLQMFNLAKGSSPTSPQYECSLAPEGCHRNDDCHVKVFSRCRCYGTSCIKYEEVTLDTGKTKKNAHVNRDDNSLKGHGCSYKSSKAQCYCTDESKQRTVVWPAKRGSKDVLYKAHHLNLKQLVCDRKEA